MNTYFVQRSFSRCVQQAAVAVAIIATAAAAAIAAPPQKMSVAVRDTVRGETENIVFSGPILITGTVIENAVVDGPNMIQLLVDFSGVSGIGATTGKKYVTSAQAILHRPLVALDTIRTSFPFYSDTQLAKTRTAFASLSVSYSPNAIISVTSKLTAPTPY